jgi:hypothetical protein
MFDVAVLLLLSRRDGLDAAVWKKRGCSDAASLSWPDESGCPVMAILSCLYSRGLT